MSPPSLTLPWRIQLLKWCHSRQRNITTFSAAELQARNQRPLNSAIAWLFLGSKPPLVRVETFTVQGRHGAIPVRLYANTPQSKADAPTGPLVLFFHGGGWVLGTLNTYDVLCRHIARLGNAVVVSVDYRLAPAHRFPIPLEDCYDATVSILAQATHLGLSPNRLCVAGDSAGGNLAAAVCLMARDQGYPTIDDQILIYPGLDGTLSLPAYTRYHQGPLLTHAAIRFYQNQYARNPADIAQPYFSPLLTESVAHLPPALIITAEHDPLHDDGWAWGDRLTAAGIPVQITDYPDMVHGFLSFPRFCHGTAPALAEIGQYLRQVTQLSDVG
jgi:acetyl esterase